MPKIIDVYIPDKNITAILLGLFLFCGIPVVMSLANTVFQYFIMLLSRKVAFKINLDCFEKLLYQPVSFFDETHSAELAQKCSQEVNNLIVYRVFTIPKLIANIFIGIAIVALIASNNYILALIQLLYIPFLFIPLKASSKPLEKTISGIMNNNALYRKEMQESFHSIKIIKSMQLENLQTQKVESAQKSIIKLWGKSAAIENFVGGWTNSILSWLFSGATFIVSAVFVMQGQISIGMLLAVSGYTVRLYSALNVLIKVYMEKGKAKGETAAIKKYLELTDERSFSGTKEWAFNDEIAFNNVSFTYPNTDKRILNGVNINIRKGSWVGIQGASGAGKTTLFELLLRYYDVGGGNVTVDGRDVKDISISGLRKNTAYMFQDPYIFSGSIRENIVLGRDTVNDKELAAALEICGLNKSVLDTEIDRNAGESGTTLSGGEKKRIALAQIVLKNTEVVLLDEPTSNVDPASQEEICAALKRLQTEKNLTIISISHRNEFHKYADKIYNLSDGVVQPL
jgi:ABC-type bacteriocin/lantibiotic exporter with double-glycine peptidase domain